MTKLLRHTLLVSGTALMAITFVPTLGTLVPGPLSALIASEAQARGGDDDDDNDDSGRDSDSDRDDSDDDSSGRDNDDDSDDDRDDDRDDDDNDDSSGRGRDDDDDLDDGLDDDDDDSNRRGRGGDRDEVRLIVNDRQLQGLMNGSMIPVDQNGNRLRYEVEQEHGQTEIKLRAPQGTLTQVTVIPAP